MTLAYCALLASYGVYIYFRIRYSLKTAVNPADDGSQTAYTLGFYSIFTLSVEVFCMMAMALYAGEPLNPKP